MNALVANTMGVGAGACSGVAMNAHARRAREGERMHLKAKRAASARESRSIIAHHPPHATCFLREHPLANPCITHQTRPRVR
jgi:hypothetical protein